MCQKFKKNYRENLMDIITGSISETVNLTRETFISCLKVDRRWKKILLEQMILKMVFLVAIFIFLQKRTQLWYKSYSFRVINKNRKQRRESKHKNFKSIFIKVESIFRNIAVCTLCAAVNAVRRIKYILIILYNAQKRSQKQNNSLKLKKNIATFVTNVMIIKRNYFNASIIN